MQTSQGFHPPYANDAYCHYFSKIFKFPPLFLFFSFFGFPYFDHDAFTHHAFHVLDASEGFHIFGTTFTLVHVWVARTKFLLLK